MNDQEFLIRLAKIRQECAQLEIQKLNALINELSQGGQDEGPVDTPHPDYPTAPPDPIAKSFADLVTPKQLGMIRALAREAGVDADNECESLMRCKTEELSKRAASSFIDHLKGLEQRPARRSA